MDTVITAVLFPVLVAFIGTYLNQLRLAKRADRLSRINKQLSEFYGPMFALTQSSDNAWRAFRSKYRQRGSFFGDGQPPTEDELKAWRLWMSTVFMPINTQLYQLVLTKSDLLIEAEMPRCLLDLAAHVVAYQTVIEKWKVNDFSEYTSVINYPNDLIPYAQKSFELLKAQQTGLLGGR